RHYAAIVAAGGTCAMVSVNAVGLSATKAICDRGDLVIHGHRNGWGMLTRCPSLGMDFAAYQKIWRLAGVDQLHVNGIANKFWESDDSVVRSIEACLKLLFAASEAPASGPARPVGVQASACSGDTLKRELQPELQHAGSETGA